MTNIQLGRIYRHKFTNELFVPYEFSSVENDGEEWDTIQVYMINGDTSWVYASIFEDEDEFELLQH